MGGPLQYGVLLAPLWWFLAMVFRSPFTVIRAVNGARGHLVSAVRLPMRWLSAFPAGPQQLQTNTWRQRSACPMKLQTNHQHPRRPRGDLMSTRAAQNAGGSKRGRGAKWRRAYRGDRPSLHIGNRFHMCVGVLAEEL